MKRINCFSTCLFWVCLALLSNPIRAVAETTANRPSSGAHAACDDAGATQIQLNACAQEAFEQATAEYSAAYRQLSQSVGNAQRKLLRQVQTEWMQYRVKACEFERNGVEGGSAAPMVYWQCQTRMTQERTAELQRHLSCEEGDLSCMRPAQKP